MAAEKRSRMERRGTMDEIEFLMDGLKSGEFEVCDEEDEDVSTNGEVRYQKSAFDRRLDELSLNIDAIRSEAETIRTHANLMLRDLNKLISENESIDEYMNDLEMDIDEFDMFNRENNIMIIGVPENKNEDAIETALDLFREKLNIHLERDTIVFAQRISQKRHLMLQFIDPDHKDTIIHARRRLKGTGVVIYEDLSPRRYDLLNRARNVQGVAAWTVRGRITAIQNYVKYNVDSIADVTMLQDNNSPTTKTDRCIFRYKMI